MSIPSVYRTVIILTATLMTGCASMQQSKQFGKFETQLQQGQVQAATNAAIKLSGVDKATGNPTDLLWALQSGSLLRMQQDYDRSNQFFDASEALMKEADTRNAGVNVALEASSFLVNDTVLPYDQSHYDGVMTNTYKALNFSALNQRSYARIEWNRVDDRQRRAVDAFAEQIRQQQEDMRQSTQESSGNLGRSLEASNGVLAKSGVDMSAWQPYEGFVNPFSTYMHGLFFLLNAETSSDYSRAQESFERAYSMTHNPVAKDDMEMASRLMNGYGRKNLEPKVWVIYESGLAPKLEEMRIDLPIVLSSSDIHYTGIALPKLVERQGAYSHIIANNVNTTLLSDMDKIVKAEFREGFNYILFKELARATAKTITQHNLADQAPAAGLLTAVAQAATTSADIRSWSTLPKEFQVAKIDRPSDGIVHLRPAGSPRPLDVPINQESQFSIIYVKAISKNQVPSVEVISLYTNAAF